MKKGAVTRTPEFYYIKGVKVFNPYKTARKGGIGGLIAGLSIPIAKALCELLNLPDESVPAVAGFLTALTMGLIDFFRHR